MTSACGRAPRVCIVNAYTRTNAGDAALLDGLIGQIRDAFEAADVTYCGLEDPQRWLTFDGARNVGSVRRWVGARDVARPVRMLRKMLALALLLAPGAVTRVIARYIGSLSSTEAAAELREIRRADLVVGLGGGYVIGPASLAGTLNVAFVLLPLAVASRLDKAVVLAPQSYGPFASGLQRRMARRVLRRIEHIEVREDTSRDVLRRLGIDPAHLHRGVDTAFAGVEPSSAEVVEHLHAPGNAAGPLVGITARQWLDPAGQAGYETALARFVDWLITERGARVTLIPQVTADDQDDDDRAVSRRIARLCTTHPTVVDDQFDHRVLRRCYGELDYLIGTRFHSVIFALTARVPAIAIEYEHKTSGIMRDLGLSKWVIPIGGVTSDRLIRRFIALEADREGYLDRLESGLPDYERKAAGFVDVLRLAIPSIADPATASGTPLGVGDARAPVEVQV
jgi:colanic acid/amylovoran biosynthesis protein